MKKKGLVTVISLLGLLGGVLFANSSVKNAGPDYNPCPNGCYAGESACYCYTWEYNQEDAKSGGATEIQDIIG